ncbi:MAG: DNA primase [Candidatus Bipolaricaulota bacterium]
MAERADLRAIKERTDIVSLVSRYVTLAKSGASYKGRCPFHQDSTPSMVVNPEKGLWHCFGCGAGGDAIAFLMKIERLSFLEAAGRLAEEAGLSLERGREDGEREKLRLVVAAAAEHFAANLHGGREGRRARDYLTGRGFDEAAWKRYGLGYALPGWDGIKRALAGKFGIPALLAAGLLVEGDKGVYDRFRDRAIFPIHDLSGRPVAFGGRAFDGEPKYLNSPATPLFDKSRFLYGLHSARDAMRDARFAVLVEGYTDVLTLHEAGIANVVGSMGTALTQGQAELFKRFVDDVVIAYDRDAAGGAAAVRGMQILRNSGLGVRVAVLAEGEDPDSLVRRHGAEAMREALRVAVPFHTFYLDSLAKAHDASTVSGKERILAAAREFYHDVQSLPLRDQIARGIAELLDLPWEGVARELSSRVRRVPRPAEEPADTAPPVLWGPEDDLLALALRGEVEWDRVSAVAGLDDFSPANRPIVEALADAPKSPTISRWIVDRLQGQPDAAERAAYYALAPVDYGKGVESVLEQALDRLVRVPAVERKLEAVATELKSAAGDRARWEELTRLQQELMKERQRLVSKDARRGLHGREEGEEAREGAARATRP